MELKMLFTPIPSLAIVRFWQGLVEIILRTLCIVLIVLAFIGGIAAVRDLGGPETPVAPIEALRYRTRSPSGWILLVTLIALTLEVLILIVRFLGLPAVNKYSTIFIVIDMCISFAIAVCFFGGALPLGIHATEWAKWRSRGTDMENTIYGLYGIVPSVGAEAAFSFLASFGFTALGIWMTVFLILKWNKNLDQYIVNPRTIEIKKVTDLEADVQPVTELKGGQLEFTEENTG